MPRTSAPACRPGDPRWEAAARIVVGTEPDIFRVVPEVDKGKYACRYACLQP